jgi:F-type H+-transporting ATPase subunit delta
MKNNEAVLRYSKALYLLDGSKEKRLEILKALHAVWIKTPKLFDFFDSPLISNKDKKGFIREIIGSNADEKLLGFFDLLIENHRCKLIPAIIENYQKKVTEDAGIIDMMVKTAIPIDDNTKKVLQEKLEKLHQKKVRIKENVDPSIIGGAILTFGNKMIDSSIKGRLEKLRKELCK